MIAVTVTVTTRRNFPKSRRRTVTRTVPVRRPGQAAGLTVTVTVAPGVTVTVAPRALRLTVTQAELPVGRSSISVTVSHVVVFQSR
jgi:hypothetical protein